jgi:hypothetical protein
MMCAHSGGCGVRMLYVGVSTMEQNVGASDSCAFVSRKFCHEEKFSLLAEKNMFRVKPNAFE